MRLAAISRSPVEFDPEPPLLVLLHGLAADENDLFGLATELDRRLKVVSIRAPYETGYGGYCWFGIEFLPDGSRIIDEEQAKSSLDILLEDLTELGTEATGSKIFLGGFSQGAMLAAATLLARPRLVDGCWLMSGRYLPFLDRQPKSELAHHVLVQHGLYDEVVSAIEGRELAEILKAHGHDVSYREYPMAHQICYESIQDANAWLQELIA